MAEDPNSPFANPMGRAFAKVVEDPDFAQMVREDPKATLARFELTDDEYEAVVADAQALDVEVEGFSFPRFGQKSFADLLGGLRTPAQLGINSTARYGWDCTDSCCLTCT